jgi:hypothetical protein
VGMGSVPLSFCFVFLPFSSSSCFSFILKFTHAYLGRANGDRFIWLLVFDKCFIEKRDVLVLLESFIMSVIL